MPYRKQLSKDKILRPIIKKQGVVALERKKNICLWLCASIISQQLSTKAAAVIYARFLALFKTASPKPADVLAVSHELLRGVGLSNSKAAYVKNVCTFFKERRLTDVRIYKMRNEEIYELLIQIKGVGQWTVEMLLMFALARENIFSAGDLGIQKAMIHLYKISHNNSKDLSEKMKAIAECWHPYKTYACRYLWRSLDDAK